MNKKIRRELRLAKTVLIRSVYKSGGCGECRDCCETRAVMEMKKPYWRAWDEFGIQETRGERL